MDTFLKKIINNNQTCVFISPHLDDAMLSAGGLINNLSKKTKVIVINVFTESSDKRQTLSAWKFVKDMGYEKPSILFAERRKEDKEAFSLMGIEPINLGFPDALWRRKNGMFSSLLGRLLPEFAHVYPTYRWHMTKGIIANSDRKTLSAVADKIKEVLKNEKNPIIFAPLGIGKHVDHSLVREVCKAMFDHNLVYWSDFPYNARENNEGTPPEGYKKAYYEVNRKTKEELIKAYRTQVSGLFQGGIIPSHKEIFFIPEAKKDYSL